MRRGNSSSIRTSVRRGQSRSNKQKRNRRSSSRRRVRRVQRRRRRRSMDAQSDDLHLLARPLQGLPCCSLLAGSGPPARGREGGDAAVAGRPRRHEPPLGARGGGAFAAASAVGRSPELCSRATGGANHGRGDERSHSRPTRSCAPSLQRSREQSRARSLPTLLCGS